MTPKTPRLWSTMKFLANCRQPKHRPLNHRAINHHHIHLCFFVGQAVSLCWPSGITLLTKRLTGQGEPWLIWTWTYRHLFCGKNVLQKKQCRSCSEQKVSYKWGYNTSHPIRFFILFILIFYWSISLSTPASKNKIRC